MKKWAKYLVVAMLLAVAAFAMAGANDPAATFTLTPNPTDPMPGETVKLTYMVKLANSVGQEISGIESDIKYDPAIYTFVSAENGTKVTGCNEPRIDQTNGIVSFSYTPIQGGYTPESEADEEFVFGTVTLAVKDSVTSGTKADIEFENPVVSIGVDPIPTTATGAKITVAAIPKGSVTYTLEPESGTFAAAPMYKVDGDAGHASGSKYEVEFPDRSVDEKKVQITFTDAAGYFTPKGVEVTIKKGDNLTPTATYLTKGKATVTITPPAAVTAGAKWKLDGEANWRDSGTTVSDLAEGTYTIKYKEATDYITPADGSFTIANEKDKNVANITTNYKEKGSLTVNLTPNTAKWKLDAETTERASGDSVKVNAGTHTIHFCAVDGYTTPAAETVNVPEEGTTVSFAYKKQGSLSYTLTPNTAQWKIDGKTDWKNSGDKIDKLDAGSYTVKFKDATGYFTPANETVAVAVGETKTATKKYTELGNVTVTINKVGSTTPKWYLNGTAYVSGAKAENLPAGKYTVSFEEIAGYHKPADKTFEVKATNAPGANTFSYLNQDYGDAFGYVTVNFTPSGVAGQWSVDGKTWNDGGKKVEIKTGNYTVQFKDVDGYKKPDNQTVEVKVGESVTLNAAYLAKGKIDDKDFKPQTEAPTVKPSPTQPASVTDVAAGVLTAEENKAAEDNLLIGGTDKIAGLPEGTEKVNLVSSFKLSVTHASSGNEDLQFILTLADGISFGDKQQVAVMLPANTDKTKYSSFDAVYDKDSKTLMFTVTNFANFFSDAPALVAAVDVKEPEPEPTPSSSSGGGCNAGYGAFALLFAIPLIFKKRK